MHWCSFTQLMVNQQIWAATEPAQMPALSTFTRAIGAYCRQDDIEEVELYLNRQIRLMCERENIRIA